jgi:hypothetical protein
MSVIVNENLYDSGHMKITTNASGVLVSTYHNAQSHNLEDLNQILHCHGYMKSVVLGVLNLLIFLTLNCKVAQYLIISNMSYVNSINITVC